MYAKYFEDYRRKIYVILALTFLFIYIKLYSKTDNKKKKQILSSGLMYLLTHPFYIYLLLFSYYLQHRKEKPIYLSLKNIYVTVRYLFCL